MKTFFKRISFALIILSISALFLMCDYGNIDKNEVTINFFTNEGILNDENGSALSKVITKYDNIITLPTPSKEGYTFDGWFLDNNTFNIKLSTTITISSQFSQNTNIYAKWIIDSYILSFYDENILLEEKTYNFGEVIFAILTPIKNNFKFEFWYEIGFAEEYNFLTMPARNVKLQVKWKALEIKKFTINFDKNSTDGIDPSFTTITKEEFETYQPPTEPMREAYLFEYWFITDENIPADIGVSFGNITYKAKWKFAFENGIGTSLNPYQIKTSEQLKNLSFLSKTFTYYSKYFILIDNISLNATENFDSIGKYDKSGHDIIPDAFAGNFDGNYKTIFNLNINQPTENYVGLFKVTSGKIENIFLDSPKITGKNYVGAISGYSKFNIEKCRIYNGDINGNDFTGGITGIINGRLNHAHYCAFDGNISGGNKIGGIVGENEGFVTNCYSNVNIQGNEYVGGIVGYNRKSVQLCYTGMKYVNGKNYVGGIVGAAEILGNYGIYACFNLSDVRIRNTASYQYTAYIGGILGASIGNDIIEIRGCYNNGYIRYESNSYFDMCYGYIIGYSNNSNNVITANCYSFIYLINTGYAIFNRYSGDNLTESNTILADIKTLSFYQDPQNFKNNSGYKWDFNNVWKFNSTSLYPIFIYEI